MGTRYIHHIACAAVKGRDKLNFLRECKNEESKFWLNLIRNNIFFLKCIFEIATTTKKHEYIADSFIRT